LAFLGPLAEPELLHKILLVDDHDVVRNGLRQMLDGHWTICGEAANGQEAVEKAIELQPDLILMDISMPVFNGIEATRRLRKLKLPAKIAILSMHDSAEIARQVKEAGADAFLVKTCGGEELLKALAALFDGKPGSRSPAA
jgi:DNA-binding NarL/FixJ family response regulator